MNSSGTASPAASKTVVNSRRGLGWRNGAPTVRFMDGSYPNDIHTEYPVATVYADDGSPTTMWQAMNRPGR
ncbi:hypothetical protein MAUB_58400 [Mycolicibacterium aubagnense]|uniref:Uncharacterized protein n=1 Tax=Mycolicibacterium aubagnense TaxID=319707 RepID=A0ABM7IMR4_9MYCO|nr:hypothetical protein MAUB_58400 [Mycolicibacterium aubagnense]